MNITTPATKRQRIDPHALDDETLPARGQSVLGKRHRVQDNNYFYDNQSTQAVMRRDPNSNQNDSKDNDISMDGGMDMGNNSNNNNNNNSNTGLFGSNFGGFNNNNNNNNNNGMNQQSGFMNSNNNNNNNSGFGGFGGFGNNNNSNNNNGSGGLWQNPPIKFTRGEWIDVKVTDTDDGESQWMCGVMTKDLDDKVQIHIPRQGTKILDKTSQDLAPVGTHTEGFN